MKVEVFILIVCDEGTEYAQKYKACTLVERRLKSIHGFKSISYTGTVDGDITAFAEWEEDEIPYYVELLKEIQGIKNVTAKVLVTI